VAADGGELARRLVAMAAVEQAAPADGRLQVQLERARLRLAGERGPAAALRSLPVVARLGLALILLLGASVLLHALHPQHALVDLTLHALVFGGAAAVLLWPLDRTQPAFARPVSAALALILPPAFAVFVSLRAQEGGTASPLGCLGLGAALSLSFLALLRMLDRRAALGAERVLLAGGLAGVAGNALLHLHCPVHALVHLLVGHAALGLVAVAAAWGLGRAGALRG
jgi:hypothetical protein